MVDKGEGGRVAKYMGDSERVTTELGYASRKGEGNW